MQCDVKLFKIEASYDGEPRSGFIYAASAEDAEGLFVNEWTWGTHDDVDISTKAILVADAKAEVKIYGGAPVARFLAPDELAWWRMTLEPETSRVDTEKRLPFEVEQ